MTRLLAPLARRLEFLLGISALFGLYLTSLYSYLLFHSLAEMFSIVIAGAIFVVAWNSRRLLDNDYLLFVGIAFLFIGAIDLLHTLAYKGMGVFPESGSSLAAQLWITARYLQAISFLIAPLFLRRKLRVNVMFTSYALALGLLLSSIFYWKVFPDCFIEGVGLTPFKIISEYLISLILAASLALFIQNRKSFDHSVLRMVVASLVLAIASELAFTFYIDVYDLSNLTGHLFKILSFSCLYGALVTTGISRPHAILFRDLKLSEEESKGAAATEYAFRKAIEDSMLAGVVAFDSHGRLTYVNPAFCKMVGWTSEELLGAMPPFPFWPPEEISAIRDNFEAAMRGQALPKGVELRFRRRNEEHFDVLVLPSPLIDSKNVAIGWLACIYDITERKRAEDQAQRQLERLAALRAVDLAITASLDLRVTLNVLLDQATSQLGADAASVLLLNPHTQRLEYAAGRGFRSSAITESSLRLGEGHAGRAALERRLVAVPNLAQDPGAQARAPLLEENFVAYWAAPLISKGQVGGVLEIFHRSPLALDPEWLGFLESLAGQAAIAIDNARLFDDLQRSNTDLRVAYDATLEGWVKALDLRHKETEGHTQRVTEMAVRLARALGLEEAEVAHIRRGALLHDIGKMGVSDGTLLKPGPLTNDEWTIMRRHPEYAYEFLSRIAFLRPALEIPYCHHEKWDGSGYPRGLRGEEIPLAARLFAVVDVWDALRSQREYRPAWPEEKVREHIRSLAGTHFDPQVVVACLRLLESDAG